MMTMHHISQGITGPLRNWRERDWKNARNYITQEGKQFGSWQELKAEFQRLANEGYEVIPSAGCDNFDKVKGCLGHPDEVEK